jgi:hypothetical protein
MNLPAPTQDNYPHTFTKLRHHGEEVKNWFTVVFTLLASAENAMKKDSSPISAVSAGFVDALCLSPADWKITFPEPSAEQLIEAVFEQGFAALRPTAEFIPWMKTLMQMRSRCGFFFEDSVGGKLLMQVMKKVLMQRVQEDLAS